MTNPFATIDHALEELRAGRMVILVDSEDRENEGDLVIAADYANAEAINFMAHYGRGLICLPMQTDLIDKLRLPMMATQNRSPYGTAFTVSIEAANGVSTGISTADRARTIQVAIDPQSGPDDIISPGHIFPLRAREGGVLERTGQTEGSVDLMKLAGLTPAAVICEIMNADGSMSRRDQLLQFAREHQIVMITIEDLIRYRIRHELLIDIAASSRIPLQKYGEFTMTVFTNQLDNAEHFVLMKPSLLPQTIPLVRIHSECITGDVFGSSKCDCGSQLDQSMTKIAAEGGMLIYLRQEGRGIGLANKLKAYQLQEKGLDTVEANIHLGLPIDNRDYAVAYQILKYYGIDKVRLLTNNPTKLSALTDYGISISERVSLEIKTTEHNRCYLKTKQQKLGHLLSVE